MKFSFKKHKWETVKIEWKQHECKLKLCSTSYNISIYLFIWEEEKKTRCTSMAFSLSIVFFRCNSLPWNGNERAAEGKRMVRTRSLNNRKTSRHTEACHKLMHMQVIVSLPSSHCRCCYAYLFLHAWHLSLRFVICDYGNSYSLNTCIIFILIFHMFPFFISIPYKVEQQIRLLCVCVGPYNAKCEMLLSDVFYKPGLPLKWMLS